MQRLQIGTKNTHTILVDDDFTLPDKVSLSVSKNGHVRMLRSTGERRPSGSYVYEQMYLQRYIMGCSGDKTVLFIDRDTLNLQKENLMVCERGVNVRAQRGQTGRFKGVHFSKQRMKWIAQITHNRKCHHIGSFDTEEHAASAYNHAARRLHGAHAFINILPEDQ